jgi:hypothetical protein
VRLFCNQSFEDTNQQVRVIHLNKTIHELVTIAREQPLCSSKFMTFVRDKEIEFEVKFQPKKKYIEKLPYKEVLKQGFDPCVDLLNKDYLANIRHVLDKNNVQATTLIITISKKLGQRHAEGKFEY